MSTSAARRRRRAPAPGRCRRCATVSSRTATRSARAPGLEPAGVGPAEAVVAGSARRAARPGVNRPRCRGAQPLVQLERRAPPRTGRSRRAGRCRATAARRRRRSARAGPMPSARSRSVVGQKQAVVPARRAAAMSTVGEVGGVHRGACAGPSAPCVGQQLGRRAAVVARGRPRSRPAARTGARAAGGRRRSAATTGSAAAGTARTEWIADADAAVPVARRSAATRAAHASASASAKRRCTSSSGWWPSAVRPPAR